MRVFQIMFIHVFEQRRNRNVHTCWLRSSKNCWKRSFTFCALLELDSFKIFSVRSKFIFFLQSKERVDSKKIFLGQRFQRFQISWSNAEIFWPFLCFQSRRLELMSFGYIQLCVHKLWFNWKKTFHDTTPDTKVSWKHQCLWESGSYIERA